MEGDGKPTVCVNEVHPSTPKTVSPPLAPHTGPWFYRTVRTTAFSWLVRRIDGICYLATSGVSQPVMSQYPSHVWGLAYPSATANPPNAVPATAVPGTLLNGGADWRFTQADGNLVPGSFCCEYNPTGADNSMLAVWFRYPNGAEALETTPFRAYCQLGSSSVAPPMAAIPAPATLFAAFTGSLAPLGSVKLTWNGVGWTAVSPGLGTVLSLSQNGAAFQLLAAGPGVSFVVAGPPSFQTPFVWTAAGVALGNLAGPFSITLTE